MPVADDFRVQLNDAEAEKIKQEIESRTSSAIGRANQDLAMRLYDAVFKMSEKLSQPDVVFRNSLVSNLCELVNLIPALNITDDQRLEECRKKAEEMLCQSDPQILREDISVRSKTAKDATDILDTMSGYFGPMAMVIKEAA